MKKLREKIWVLMDEEASVSDKKQNKINIEISFTEVAAHRYSYVSLEGAEVFIKQRIPRRNKLEKNFIKETIQTAFSYYDDELKYAGFSILDTPYILRYYANIQKHKDTAKPLKAFIKNRDKK
jgi:hypothetical protein